MSRRLWWIAAPWLFWACQSNPPQEGNSTPSGKAPSPALDSLLGSLSREGKASSATTGAESEDLRVSLSREADASPPLALSEPQDIPPSPKANPGVRVSYGTYSTTGKLTHPIELDRARVDHTTIVTQLQEQWARASYGTYSTPITYTDKAEDTDGEPAEGGQEGKEPHPTTSQEEKDPDPMAYVVVEKEPQPINIDEIKKRIGHPPAAKEAGIQGKVIVRVLVGKNGKYERHIVIKSPHKILTEAVEKELPNLEFTPGIQAGKPIKVWVTIPFDFQLR